MNYFVYEKFIKNVGCKDRRLEKIPQNKYEFSYGGSGHSNIDINYDLDNFELKDMSEISAELDNFIQNEDSGVVQSFFDKYVSKLIYKLKHFIFIGGLLLYTFNCHQLSSIKLETHDPAILKASNPV